MSALGGGLVSSRRANRRNSNGAVIAGLLLVCWGAGAQAQHLPDSDHANGEWPYFGRDAGGTARAGTAQSDALVAFALPE